MALSLTASQQNIFSIFDNDNIFVVPAFQRSYSWGYEQCDQLYQDLTNAYNCNEEYFLGNIIIAKGDNDEYHPQIVDGQQRLLTIYLILKIISVLAPKHKKYRRLLYVTDSTEEHKEPKIVTNVIESTDQIHLFKIFQMSPDKVISEYQSYWSKNKLKESDFESKIDYNFFLMLKWFIDFHDASSNSFDGFVEHFMRKVYLLPIELSGNTIDIANERALTIFETINNRGLNLEDADILKARLYDRAKLLNEGHKLIEAWASISSCCNDLEITIDDLFRYYYHIVRASQNITTAETKLRSFFVTDKDSPIYKKKYSEVLDDLRKILDILSFINEEKDKQSELSLWVQIIFAYTNFYPRYAMVAYLYHYTTDCDKADFASFLSNVVKFVYSQGSTTSVKFELYSVIHKAYHGEKQISYGISDSSALTWKRMAPLRKGFLLLYYTLKYPDFKNVKGFLCVDRIVPVLSNKPDSIGNYFVVDCAKSRASSWCKRLSIYESRIDKKCLVEDIIQNTNDPNSLITIREKNIINTLRQFMQN